ncbi:MAG: hypothetical protein IKC51_00625 [Myxococcaceae bacterium]|nr:hypothetical protein [Myxococcaceae bacterium]
MAEAGESGRHVSASEPSDTAVTGGTERVDTASQDSGRTPGPTAAAVSGGPDRGADHMELPPSKSHLIRALVAASLADTPSEILLFPSSAWAGAELSAFESHLPRDAWHALRATTSLGATCRLQEGRAIEVIPGAMARSKRLFCGESALLLRLMLPIASALGGIDELDGEGTLPGRPIDELVAPLTLLGVRAMRKHPHRALPLRLAGHLRGGDITLDGGLTSQLASGLLMALPLCAGPSRLTIERPTSRPYLDLTRHVLADFGVAVQALPDATFAIEGGQRYRGTRVEVEADWSAAAFALVLGAIRRDEPPIALRGLLPTSRQADRAICDILTAIGATIVWNRGTLLCRRGDLTAFDLSLTDAPDLLPPLATLALFCPGTSRLRDIGRTRFKESDRPAALIGELGKLGARLWTEGGDLCIQGGPLRGGQVSSRGDHRLAMAIAVAAHCGGVDVDIAGGDLAVRKSFPRFFASLNALRRTTTANP